MPAMCPLPTKAVQKRVSAFLALRRNKIELRLPLQLPMRLAYLGESSERETPTKQPLNSTIRVVGSERHRPGPGPGPDRSLHGQDNQRDWSSNGKTNHRRVCGESFCTGEATRDWRGLCARVRRWTTATPRDQRVASMKTEFFESPSKQTSRDVMTTREVPPYAGGQMSAQCIGEVGLHREPVERRRP